MATATNQFTAIKHCNKSHLQEHMSTFITVQMLEAAGNKDTCSKLKCKFFLFPGYNSRTWWCAHGSLLRLLIFYMANCVIEVREFNSIHGCDENRFKHCYKCTWSISYPEMVLGSSAGDKTLYQAEGLDPYVQALLHTDMKLGAQLVGKGGNTSPNSWWFIGNRTWQLGDFVSFLFGSDGIFFKEVRYMQFPYLVLLTFFLPSALFKPQDEFNQ